MPLIEARRKTTRERRACQGKASTITSVEEGLDFRIWSIEVRGDPYLALQSSRHAGRECGGRIAGSNGKSSQVVNMFFGLFHAVILRDERLQFQAYMLLLFSIRL